MAASLDITTPIGRIADRSQRQGYLFLFQIQFE